ncbi:AAA ATPase central domain protein [Dehalogenimonas lykanthroporepellens BL-DC-9]|nr:AAA ATPase central domain protein [Dehalogenimonas lykanthroporepellens BL-DC-9]
MVDITENDPLKQEVAIDPDYDDADEQTDRERRSFVERTLTDTLGEGERKTAVVIQPVFYADLVAWALKTWLEREGWRVLKATGNEGQSMPHHETVEYAPDCQAEFMMNGILTVARQDTRLTLIVRIKPRCQPQIQITGRVEDASAVTAMAEGLSALIKNENFYRHACVRMNAYYPALITPESRSWNSIILDEDTLRDIRQNTIGFFRKSRQLARMGVPRKRGLILSGHPGTGKTLICKAIMKQTAGKYTCITTDPGLMDEPNYIRAVYALAGELAPSFVFIEDLDQIGQSRSLFPFHNGSPLNTLLEVMDGAEACDGIITIATTNSLDSLDSALIRRPSRFDRIIELPHPDEDKRRSIIDTLSRRIRLDADIKAYITRSTRHFTPAQLQEVIYTLAIDRAGRERRFRTTAPLAVTREDVDRAIRRVNSFRQTGSLGFRPSDCGPGDGVA